MKTLVSTASVKNGCAGGIPSIVGGWKFHPLDNPQKFQETGKACGRGYQDPGVSHFMKIQRKAHLRNLSLAREHDNYKLMEGRVCNLAQVIDYGEEGPWTFLVVEDLGMDLGRFYRAWGSLQLYMVGQIVSGMLRRLEEVHLTGFIHGDVKPGNFIFRRLDSQVSMIDLETVQRCPTPSGAPCGTPMWASRHSLRGEALSFRDDLHSLAYCLVYFLRGTLPWTEEDSKDAAKLARIKAEIPVAELCKRFPRPSARFVKHCFSLDFSSTPNYPYLRNCMLDMWSA